jgi:hypothetical protein
MSSRLRVMRESRSRGALVRSKETPTRRANCLILRPRSRRRWKRCTRSSDRAEHNSGPQFSLRWPAFKAHSLSSRLNLPSIRRWLRRSRPLRGHWEVSMRLRARPPQLSAPRHPQRCRRSSSQPRRLPPLRSPNVPRLHARRRNRPAPPHLLLSRPLRPPSSNSRPRRPPRRRQEGQPRWEISPPSAPSWAPIA